LRGGSWGGTAVHSCTFALSLVVRWARQLHVTLSFAFQFPILLLTVTRNPWRRWQAKHLLLSLSVSVSLQSVVSGRHCVPICQCRSWLLGETGQRSGGVWRPYGGRAAPPAPWRPGGQVGAARRSCSLGAAAPARARRSPAQALGLCLLGWRSLLPLPSSLLGRTAAARGGTAAPTRSSSLRAASLLLTRSSLLPSPSLAAAARSVPTRVLRRRPWRGGGRAARGARGGTMAPVRS